ncbi:hypothetical protein CL6EHI_071360 [Entamoeba histolytica]|uniref:SGNH hydrolase-type esterase domain-containing protein n=2 Tax=Entamoeba histolytica TaxID=5759 RepID=B1N3Y2_ENTH1|nr:hypothetical protein EHI_142680 [Entamoeba histolytica HM-1:IMSS]XP_001914102.1 hypothetical protein EHI_071360 [Entamoeba histolytica HM-1:IMSS]GAT97026.1 hypothetical protein CL6EHI_142680 [Entamoeba histolytica]EDS89124.1 hypothetical protein EHI_071360 [Entamoeba histolytica HM-1:IMSS]EDS89322.1 hypothetical protein EHI_142680 [Entamoeba histolytica HM-1:IMSS]GAT98435.1 hypothetical protein CL6EHI_071360 [Entamoeba histolytica]|eukprot:XP_001913897.1 hypothetical protein EHI_142680 [Entamoeba histolytica HM-1:IMSS]
MNNEVSIFFYGDSNLYGIEAVTYKRYSSKDRFSNIVIEQLKKEFTKVNCIVDGKPARSLKYENIPFGITNGLKDYDQFLLKITSNPFSTNKVLILALCINDILSKATSQQVIDALQQYIEKVQKQTKIIILIPPPLQYCTFDSWKSTVNPVIAESLNFVHQLKVVVEMWKKQEIIDGFVDLDGMSVGADGVHFTSDSHHKIAEKLLSILHDVLN